MSVGVKRSWVKKLLLIETRCKGHHAGYVRWIVDEALRRGLEVVLASTKACIAHPRLSKLPSLPGVALMYVEDSYSEGMDRAGLSNLIRREFHYHRLFSQIYKRCSGQEKIDFIFVPYLDHCLYAIGLLGSPFGNAKWGGLVMRPSFHYGEVGVKASPPSLSFVKKMLFHRVLRVPSVDVVFTIDETLPVYIEESRLPKSENIQYIEDPVELHNAPDRDVSRSDLNIPLGKTVLLVYGAISFRKGIRQIIEAMSDENFSDDIHVVLAGVLESDVRRYLWTAIKNKASLEERIHIFDGFATPDDEARLFSASDIVWLGYSGHYNMSGVLVLAGAYERPVLACKEGLIGWMTDRYQLGLTADVQDRKSVLQALKRLSSDRDLAWQCGCNGRYRFSSHTSKNFSKKILNRILASE